MRELLRTLTETFGPSGYEQAVREVIRDAIMPLVDEMRVDTLGNLIARKGSLGKDGVRIMVAAHMEEIGLIANHVDGRGFVRFTTMGSPFNRFMPGGRVRFVSGVQGVIGAEHPGKSAEIPPTEKLFIDVGASSVEDCPVKVGEVAAFERPFMEMGRRLVAKSMGDRAGVLVAIEVLRRLAASSASGGSRRPGPNEVHFVFTVQEQVGNRGATVSAYGIDPEIGLAIYVSPAGDTPGAEQRGLVLGKGPAIKVKDDLMMADPRVVAWMTQTAEANKIPYQREVLTEASSDDHAIQLARTGVLAGGLGIPCRYLRSPSEMVDMDDLENSIALMKAILSRPFGTKI